MQAGIQASSCKELIDLRRETKEDLAKNFYME